MRTAVLANEIKANTWTQRVARDAAMVLGGSLLIALCAQVAVRMPFSPVPVTLQTLAVLLAGASLGSRRGAMSVMVYLAQGLSGLPVFAGGAFGPSYLLGPTGGYLLGFVAAAYAVGWLAERGWDRRPATMLAAMAMGSAVIYAVGLPWLAAYVGDAAWETGLLPFLVGDAVK
ncbi:MAG: biotin transporter BioY, partial [Anaerolineae bacterium]